METPHVSTTCSPAPLSEFVNILSTKVYIKRKNITNQLRIGYVHILINVCGTILDNPKLTLNNAFMNISKAFRHFRC